MKESVMKVEVPVFGVKLHFLRKLATMMDPNSTMYEVSAFLKSNIINDEPNKSVAEIFYQNHTGNSTTHEIWGHFDDNFTLHPNIYLCYAWSYSISIILDLLREYISMNSLENVSVWIDIFCFPQIPSPIATSNILHTKEYIYCIKNLLLLIPDIIHPTIVNRTWCIFEIFLNCLCNGKLDVYFPSHQFQTFSTVIWSNMNSLLSTLCRIDLKASVATNSMDKEMILSDIDKDDGVKQFNIIVHRQMKQWLADYIHQFYMNDITLSMIQSSDSMTSNTNQVAYLLSECSHFQEAKDLFTMTLLTYEQKYGPMDRNTLGVANNLVFVLYKLDLKEEAVSMSQRVIEGYNQSYGPDHANTVAAIITGADLLKNYERLHDSELLYRRALTLIERGRGEHHPSAISAVRNLGYLLQSQRLYAEAEKFYQRALDGYLQIYGENDKLTCDTAYNFGLLLIERKKHKKANLMFQKAYSGFYNVLGPDHESTQESKKRMIISSVKQRVLQRQMSQLSRACTVM